MTYLKKILKSLGLYIGDYCSYSDVIVHSDTAWNALKRDGICDLDLRKKGQNVLTYVSVFRFQ